MYSSKPWKWVLDLQISQRRILSFYSLQKSEQNMLNIPQMCSACSYKNLDYHQTVSLRLRLMRKLIGTEYCSLILLIFQCEKEVWRSHAYPPHDWSRLGCSSSILYGLDDVQVGPCCSKMHTTPITWSLTKDHGGTQGFKTIGEWYGKQYGLGYGMVSENGSNGMEILEKLGATKKQFESRESHGNNALHSRVQLRVLHSFSKKQSENNTIYSHHHCHVQIAQVFQSFSKKQSENQCT